MMNQDPYYDAILDGLSELDESDGRRFESCMIDLLKPDFGTLVPVTGGDDAGMDGAFEDSEGPGFLVATVSPDLLRNVTKNLTSNLKSNVRRRRVVIATSQEPTQRKLRNVIQRVKQLGFELVNFPLTREAVAKRLEQNPRICLRLLNISDAPPVLARMPLDQRPMRDLPLVGRAEDLRWLRETCGDRLVAGQPGTGKTFLLQAIAHEGGGLFVVRDDIDEIANAIREQRPSALLVEDAHTRLSLLKELRFLRSSTQGQFDIVADCWPGAAAEVAIALQLPSTAVRTLERLLPKEIAEIVKACGIRRPDFLIDQIIRQAHGRPGLASLFCHLCLAGDAGEVWRGDVLGREMRARFVNLVGEEAAHVLAGFAVGGVAGMRVDDVGELLGLSSARIRLVVSKLAAGGVVIDLGGDSIAVQPEPLRCVLVRDLFFGGPGSLPLTSFLQRVPSLEAATVTLIGAYLRGGEISRDELLGLLIRCGSRNAWKQFAWTDRDAARLVLDRHPEYFDDVADALLHHLPEEVLPRLLDAMDRATPSNGNLSTRASEIISQWCEDLELSGDEMVARKRMLVRASMARLKEAPTGTAALQALQIALGPTIRCLKPVPGDRMAYSHCQGVLPTDALAQLGSLWRDEVTEIPWDELTEWRPLLDLLEEWIWPNRVPVEIPETTMSLCRGVASEMIGIYAQAAKGRPALLRHLSQLARFIGAPDVDIGDDVFETIHPADDFDDDWRSKPDRRAEKIRMLAERWLRAQPVDVASEIQRCRREAKLAGLRAPGLERWLCDLLASEVTSPLDWFDGFLDAGLDQHLLVPFLTRAMATDTPGWVDRAVLCMNRTELRVLGVAIALGSREVPHAVLDEAMKLSESITAALDVHYFAGGLSDTVLSALLQHPDDAVAGKTALLLYANIAAKPVPETLVPVWRDAIIRTDKDAHWLREALKGDRLLARAWLERRLKQDTFWFFEFDGAAAAAISALSFEDRLAMLRLIPDSYRYADLLEFVAGSDPQLFAALLKIRPTGSLRLLPLAGQPNDRWRAKALIALDAGVTTNELVSETFGHRYSIVGSEAAMWGTWVEAWKSFLTDDDPRIRVAAKRGHDEALRRQKAAAARERAEAMYEDR